MNPEALKTSIVNVLEEIRLLMPPEARDDYLLTFAARRPSKPGWDVLVSEDSKDGLVELLRRRQDGVGGKAWTAGRDPEKVAALLAAVDRFRRCDLRSARGAEGGWRMIAWVPEGERSDYGESWRQTALDATNQLRALRTRLTEAERERDAALAAKDAEIARLTRERDAAVAALEAAGREWEWRWSHDERCSEWREVHYLDHVDAHRKAADRELRWRTVGDWQPDDGAEP
jgi:hypothetical protein